jgi:WD40 repeat protein
MKWSLVLILLFLCGCAPGNRAQWRERCGVEVRAMEGTPDGQLLFIVADGSLKSIDATTGKQVSARTLEGFEAQNLQSLGDRTLAFSPQGKELLWWRNDQPDPLEKASIPLNETVPTEQELVIPGEGPPPGRSSISGAGVSPDGTLVVCDTQGRAALWQLGEVTARITTRGRVVGSGLSPDGKTLVLVGPRKLHFYQLPQAEKRGEIEHQGRLRGLAFSPDSAHLALTMAGKVKVINNHDLSIAAGLPGVATSVTFSADGRYLCATNVGSVDVYDLKEKRARGSVTLLSVVQSEVLGTVPHVVTLREKGVDLWSLDQPEEPVWSYRKPIRMMRTKPDGVWVYTATGWLESWRLPLTGSAGG